MWSDTILGLYKLFHTIGYYIQYVFGGIVCTVRKASWYKIYDLIKIVKKKKEDVSISVHIRQHISQYWYNPW